MARLVGSPREVLRRSFVHSSGGSPWPVGVVFSKRFRYRKAIGFDGSCKPVALSIDDFKCDLPSAPIGFGSPWYANHRTERLFLHIRLDLRPLVMNCV